MSKISEQKALKAYPDPQILPGYDENKRYREGYIKGYDQAMKDLASELKRRLKHNHARAEIDRSSCEMGMAKEDKDILDWLYNMNS